LSGNIAIEFKRPRVIRTGQPTCFAATFGNLSTAMGARITESAQYAVFGPSDKYWVTSNILSDEGSWFWKFASPPNDVSASTKQNIEFFLKPNWVCKDSGWFGHRARSVIKSFAPVIVE
jgi:hypothetical protein